MYNDLIESLSVDSSSHDRLPGFNTGDDDLSAVLPVRVLNKNTMSGSQSNSIKQEVDKAFVNLAGNI